MMPAIYSKTGADEKFATLEDLAHLNPGAVDQVARDAAAAAMTAAGGKYTKPSSGIPAADLTADVRSSLASADTAVQPGQLGSAAAAPASAFASAAQGSKADTAVQPGALGSAATQSSLAFATAMQGAKADTAVQPGSLGSAASQPTSAFATAAQGAKADSAVQPAALAGKADLVDGVVPLAQLPAAFSVMVAVAEWNGTSWPARPNAILVIWSSLAYDNTVPAPPQMTSHDIWLADKDTVVAA